MLCIAVGCHPNSYILEPKISYVPQERQLRNLPPCFEPLSPLERNSDWGRELIIGDEFAKELDLYRAITSYKRALVLLPKTFNHRKLQIQFQLVFCYYLGSKYSEAITIFEESELTEITGSFPAFRNLIIILYDCYSQVGQCGKADATLQLMEKLDPETAHDLSLSSAILSADFPKIDDLTIDPELASWKNSYLENAKSVRKAQTLNAILPGAGYYYVGQQKTALTSFLINAVFIAATYQLASHNYIPAAIITGSLEFGWYFGGINGAGLAAKTYNEVLYNQYAKNAMCKQRLFPVLMFTCAF